MRGKQWAVMLFAAAGTLVPDAAAAGAWTLPSGSAWGKITWFRQHAREWYINAPEFTGRMHDAGSRRPYRFNGEYDSRAVFVEGFLGASDRLDLGLQVPWFDQQFDDDTHLDPVGDSGFSDLRLLAKWRALQAPAVVTVKAAVKMPTGEFRNEDGLIPVGEGQWDFDFILQAGRSFWPLPLYANADVGYRVRTENEEILRDPGDEWMIDLEAGGKASRGIGLALKLQMLRGLTGTDFGFPSRTQVKRITYLAPALSLSLPGNSVLELAVRQSLGGRNFPAGRQFALGLSASVEAWNR